MNWTKRRVDYVAYVYPVLAPLIRYAALKTYSKLGFEGTAGFAVALIHPVSRKIVLRLAWETIYHSTIYSYNMARAVSVILYEELVVPAAIEVRAATTPMFRMLGRGGSLGAGGVIAGVTFFAIAFPLALATTEQASYGDLYTEEIATYEHSALGQGGGMGVMI